MRSDSIIFKRSPRVEISKAMPPQTERVRNRLQFRLHPKQTIHPKRTVWLIWAVSG
jgi:hypothetical protein